jgi:hypothetical protein
VCLNVSGFHIDEGPMHAVTDKTDEKVTVTEERSLLSFTDNVTKNQERGCYNDKVFVCSGSKKTKVCIKQILTK